MLTSSFESKNIFLKILKRWIYSSVLNLSYLIFIEISLTLKRWRLVIKSYFIFIRLLLLFFFLSTFNFVYDILEMALIL